MEGLAKSIEELSKTVGAMAVDLKTVTGDVQGFRHQLEDFGQELDGVKRTLVTDDKQTAPPRAEPWVEFPQPHKEVISTMPRLVNHGPPLMNLPAGAGGYVTVPSSPKDAEDTTPTGDYIVRPRHHDFPRFAGDKPLVWLDLCLTYFGMYRVPEHHWVSSASLHLDGHAALWFQAFKRTHRLITWDALTQALVQEFGQDEYDGQMTKLLQLKQTGTVAEYKLAFEECMYHLISLDETLGNRWFVTQFVFGLREDIRLPVRLQGPASIARAASLARIQEEETEHHHPRSRPHAPTKHPTVPQLPATTTTRPDWPRKQGNYDFNRERQFRDFRRANGLCFKCGDKYSKDHQCKRSGQLPMIEVGDFGEVLSDYAVQALELLDETATPVTCCQLSIDALAGTEDEETIRLRALVGNQVMLLLIDSGSTHTFVTKAFAERAGCVISPAPALPVKVANGQMMVSQELRVSLGGHKGTPLLQICASWM
uniref:Uncharacterized protein n=1 Tax=Avena sativa TaxID=4498 RepID=A0ACD5Y7Q3_AVESA